MKKGPAKGTVNNPGGYNQYTGHTKIGQRTALQDQEKKLLKHNQALLKQDGIDLHDPQFEDPSLPEVSLDQVILKDDWEPTEENLSKIYQLAMTGVDEQTIASIAIGVPDDVYFQLRSTYPEIERTILTAQRHGQAVMATELFNEMCRKDNRNRMGVMKFYLENRAKWSQTTGLLLPRIPNHISKKPIDLLEDAQLTRLLKKSVTNELPD